MKKDDRPSLTTELLIMPDGRILVHNLTQPFAELLRELNPNEEQISSRANRIPPHAKAVKVAKGSSEMPALRTLRGKKKSETGATPVLPP